MNIQNKIQLVWKIYYYRRRSKFCLFKRTFRKAFISKMNVTKNDLNDFKEKHILIKDSEQGQSSWRRVKSIWWNRCLKTIETGKLEDLETSTIPDNTWYKAFILGCERPKLRLLTLQLKFLMANSTCIFLFFWA